MKTNRTHRASQLLILVLVMCLGSSMLFSCASVSEDSSPQSGSSGLSSGSGDTQVSTEDSTEDEVGYYGALKVTGAQLTNTEGTPVRLQGISSHGASWFPEYINYDMIKQTKEDWGCSVFRVAMYTAEYNGYCEGDEANKQALKELIDVAVQATKELDMYVIIDWHILSDANPLQNQDEALLFFEEMAQKYAHEEHVMYEICNEPNQGATWADIKSYANMVIPVIREHTNAVVLVGTPEWCQRVDEAAADPLTGFENIMYTQHFYAATHKDDHRQRMIQAVEAGLPVFVSEFGICDASGNGAIDEAEADAWLATMQELGVSYVLWNLSNKDESSAIVSSTCTKTSDLSLEDLSPCGQWLASRFTNKPMAQEKPANELDSSKPTAHELSASLDIETSWEEGTSKVTQYSASLKNTTSSSHSSWTIVIEFDQDITLVGSWNGVFVVSGSTLTITPESYNVALDAGGTVDNIGFQVKTKTSPKVLKTRLS